MKEIRIHARAGQGAITTATILGYAYFLKGFYPYAFPHFGAARMGAPMNAFLRVDTKPIRLRSQIYEPDYVLIVDPTLLRGFNCLVGLKDDGIAIINEGEGIDKSKLNFKRKLYFVPAAKIALETIGKPLANTALLGAFIAVSRDLDIEVLIKSLEIRFKGEILEKNILSAKKGFEFVKERF
ncbi:MAG: 2-oxoacid:acceptor oxidoreductase family protein [Candidatus Omnitrophica bacterium]|nr:2-oxoacid:acceptor oxidoreductase family protein [Candidatus Omnitrophota bacterium]